VHGLFPYQVSTSPVFNGMSPMWRSIPNRYSHRDCLNLSSLVLSARCYLNSAGQLGSLFSSSCFSISFIIFHCSLLYFFLFCSLSVYGLKLIRFMTVCFLFRPFGSPAAVHLEFPTSASSLMSPREVATMSSHKLYQLFLKWFGILVTL